MGCIIKKKEPIRAQQTWEHLKKLANKMPKEQISNGWLYVLKFLAKKLNSCEFIN